jgi:4-amino-4-deoxy-L-arabinose transferase-like glycosyltransferase
MIRTGALIVGLALLAALPFFLLTEGINRNDASLYYQLSVNVAAGNGLSMATAPPHNWVGTREPFYPLVMGGIFRLVGPGLGVVFLAQALMHAATALIIWRMGVALGGARVGLVAGVAVAVFPTLANYTVYTLRETFFTFLVVLAVALTVRAMRREALAGFAVAGVVWGAAILCRGVVLPVPGFIAVAVVVAAGRSWGRALRQAVVLVVCTVAAVGAWGAYSTQIDADWSPTPRVWQNLYVRASKAALSARELQMYTVYSVSELIADRLYPGNNLRSVGEGYFYRSYGEKVNAMRARGLSDADIGDTLREEALGLIAEHPGWFALTGLHELVKFNSFFQVPLINEEGFGPRLGIPSVALALARGVCKLAGFAVVALVLLGVWRLWRVLPVVVLLVVFLNAAHAGLDSIGRYAVPLIPFYLLLATWVVMQRVARPLPHRVAAPDSGARHALPSRS